MTIQPGVVQASDYSRGPGNDYLVGDSDTNRTAGQTIPFWAVRGDDALYGSGETITWKEAPVQMRCVAEQATTCYREVQMTIISTW